MKRQGTALALSGGGFRATLFHTGALIRLNELGLLRSISRFVSVSGGSITLGCLAMNWSKLKWKDGSATNLEEWLVAPIAQFCGRNIDIPGIVGGTFTPAKPISEMIKKAYKEHLFGNFQLSELPRTPLFIFQATNFSTGRAFRFGRDYVADYLIGKASSSGISLATAVTASSAFPPILSPLVLDIAPEKFEKLRGATLYDDESFRREIKLTDGGVYDNLALEPAWDSETVLVSDAGAPFEYSSQLDLSWPKQTLRALDIATAQSRGLRRRWLIDQYVRGVKKGAYWGISTKIEDYPHSSTTVGAMTHERLYGMRTRLNSFNEQEQAELINLGYAVSDAACRSHVTSIREVAFNAPFPAFPLG